MLAFERDVVAAAPEIKVAVVLEPGYERALEGHYAGRRASIKSA